VRLDHIRRTFPRPAGRVYAMFGAATNEGMLSDEAMVQTIAAKVHETFVEASRTEAAPVHPLYCATGDSPLSASTRSSQSDAPVDKQGSSKITFREPRRPISGVSTADVTPLTTPLVTPSGATRLKMAEAPGAAVKAPVNMPSVVQELSSLLCDSFVAVGTEASAIEQVDLSSSLGTRKSETRVLSNLASQPPPVVAIRRATRGRELGVTPSLKACSEPCAPHQRMFPPRVAAMATTPRCSPVAEIPEQQEVSGSLRPGSPRQPWVANVSPRYDQPTRSVCTFRELSPDLRSVPRVAMERHFNESCCSEKQAGDAVGVQAFSPRRSPKVAQAWRKLPDVHELQSHPRDELEVHWRASICQEKCKEDYLQRAATQNLKGLSPSLQGSPSTESKRVFREWIRSETHDAKILAPSLPTPRTQARLESPPMLPSPPGVQQMAVQVWCATMRKDK